MNMMNDDQLNKITEWYDEQYSKTENDIFKLIGMDLSVIAGLSIAELKQAKIMLKNALFNKIDEKLNNQATLSINELNKVYSEVANEAISSAKDMYDYKGLVLPNLKDATKPFLMQSIKEMRNLSNTKAIVIRDTQGTVIKFKDWYASRVDEAIGSIINNSNTYEQAISKVVKELGQSGLRVKYESGYTKRLDSAARQNVLDGMRQVAQKYNDQIGKEIDADGVEISAHAICAEDHLPYQGKQFTLKEFEKIQNTLERPIGKWNCKHQIYYVLLGISKPTYKESELKRYEKDSVQTVEIDGKKYTRYECTQLVNQLRNKNKYVKEELNLAKTANLNEHQVSLKKQIRQLNGKTNEVLKKANLREYTTLY